MPTCALAARKRSIIFPPSRPPRRNPGSTYDLCNVGTDDKALYDPPPTAADHAGNDGARHEEWAVDVRLDDRSPGARVRLPEPAWLDEKACRCEAHPATGVVHQNIHQVAAARLRFRGKFYFFTTLCSASFRSGISRAAWGQWSGRGCSPEISGTDFVTESLPAGVSRPTGLPSGAKVCSTIVKTLARQGHSGSFQSPSRSSRDGEILNFGAPAWANTHLQPGQIDIQRGA